MERRQFVMGALFAMVGAPAWSAPPADTRMKWRARIKG